MSDANVPAAGADVAASDPRRGRTRQKMPRGLIVVGVVVAAIVGYAVYAGASLLGQNPVIGTVSRYHVIDDTHVTYRLTVTGPADSRVVCSVVARAKDYSVVGQVERSAQLGSDGTIGLAGSITTLQRPVNAEAGTCKKR